MRATLDNEKGIADNGDDEVHFVIFLTNGFPQQLTVSLSPSQSFSHASTQVALRTGCANMLIDL